MDNFNTTDLKDLLEVAAYPCVSWLIPTVEKGRETRQNPIRFKNAMQVASMQIDHLPKGERPANDFLVSLEKMLDDDSYWRNLSSGLAVFIAPGFFRSFRLRLKLPELVVVSRRFYLKALLPLISFDMQYHILSFSQKHAQLYRGSQLAIEELTQPKLPQGMAEALCGLSTI